MTLTPYELQVLRHIQEPRDGDGIIPGAALNVATTALRRGGYITACGLTDKGRAALAEAAS